MIYTWTWSTGGSLCLNTLRDKHPEGLARYRKAMEQENCMFEQVGILPHNIGYLQLNFFGDTSVCLSTATSGLRK